MGDFCYRFLFLAYYFYEFSWICCWNNLWDFALRPSCQSCSRCCWIKIRCEVLNIFVDYFMKDKLLFIPFEIFKKCSIPFKLWILWLFCYEIFMLGKRGVTIVIWQFIKNRWSTGSGWWFWLRWCWLMRKTVSARFYRCSNKRYRSDKELWIQLTFNND